MANSNSKQLTQELASKLQAEFGERLVSVCLYGSGARESSEQTAAPVSSGKPKSLDALVIIQGFNTADLHTASPVSLWWEQKAHTLPIFLSEEEWLHSNDVFALEYADIKDWHWLAHGKDLFSIIQIDHQALRLLCELEIYKKLIFLRQRLLLFRQKPESLRALMQDANSHFAAIFRGIIRVYRPGQNVNANLEGLLGMLSEIIPGFSKEPFLAASANAKLGKDRIIPVFEQYVEQICKTNTFLNQASVFEAIH